MQAPSGITSNMQLIEACFAPLAGRALLDVGCGGGNLLGALAKRGAVPVGVDPLPSAVAAAQARYPALDIQEAAAESLPFPEGQFEGAIILNSLHHFTQDSVALALTECLRVLVKGAGLLVIEPAARGGYFEVARPVEDETVVRAAALQVLDAEIAAGRIGCAFRLEYDTAVPVTDADSVLKSLVQVDPARSERAASCAAEVQALFNQHVQTGPRGRFLDQPMIAYFLQAV
ncbi:class I SAM-dependent methyltransferase [Litorivita pollutaquae]|uniref:Class I SAM-dependent methyltransferase n=1 Tax=Litorivita pollutaquae TaxID=2200892 RepID=A0A2V4MIV9_9RHOB|nr:class I SAM-dependent methyltransferase [Litorivita pollutaquae]PYC46551.1 class I SAM-dependent methyltransferase [Litorivita pollutaquae]